MLRAADTIVLIASSGIPHIVIMGEGRTRPARRGAKWTLEEENDLLHQVRGDGTVEDIAAFHERGVGSISIRIVQLISDDRTFEDNEEAFCWARTELRKGEIGQLHWAVERANEAVESSKNWRWQGRRRRAAPVTTKTRCAQVRALWSAITNMASDQLQDAAEVDALAPHDDEMLRVAGENLFRAYGRLDLADWVVECDWPGVEALKVTAKQIRDRADVVPWCGAELLRAGLQKVPDPVDRDMVFRRLGLNGESPATLEAIGQVYGVTRERIRQRVARALNNALVNTSSGVFRSWDHVNGVLSRALRIAGDFDPSLVLAYVELVLPEAPQREAVRLITGLCGQHDGEWGRLADDVAELAAQLQKARLEELRVEKRRGLLNAKVQVLIDKAEWPPKPTEVSRISVSPCRQAGEWKGRGYGGRWESPRLGRLVYYDSHAELGVIQRVELADLVESYCEQPLEIPYRWNGYGLNYYPDLMVDLRDGRRVVVEVKGSVSDFALHQNLVKAEAARTFCHARGWGYIVMSDSTTPGDLMSRPANHAAEDLVHAHLAMGPADWRWVRTLMRRYDLRHADLAAMILRNGWYLYVSPWRLALDPLWQE